MDIHSKIKEVRQNKNFSQSYMAEKMNIALLNYGKIERGITELSVKRLYEIAEILGVNVADLLGIEVLNNNQTEKIKELEKEIEESNLKRERLKYEVSSFLILIRESFAENRYLKIVKSILPRASEFLQILEETEMKIKEDF